MLRKLAISSHIIFILRKDANTSAVSVFLIHVIWCSWHLHLHINIMRDEVKLRSWGGRRLKMSWYTRPKLKFNRKLNHNLLWKGKLCLVQMSASWKALTFSQISIVSDSRLHLICLRYAMSTNGVLIVLKVLLLIKFFFFFF